MLLPYFEQSNVSAQVNALVGQIPPWTNVEPWNRTLPIMACPSDPGATDPGNAGRTRGKRNYYFCGGDSFTGNGDAITVNVPTIVPTRGMFAALRTHSMRDCTDGTSNTIAMAEAVAPIAVNGFGQVSSATGVTSPIACAALYNKALRQYPGGTWNGDTIRGYRWGDGASYFSAFSTAVPPNSASCFTGASASHWFQGIFNSSSYHVGGTQVLLTDGSARFVSENIDAGNQATVFPVPTAQSISPYGVWGALGTRSGGEVIGEF